MAQFLISAFADETSDDIGHQIEALKRNGLAYIEPRNADGSIQKKTDAELFEIRRKLDDAGIGLSAYGSPIGKHDITEDFDTCLAKFRRAIEICKILGTPRMRMFSFFVPQEALAEYRSEVMRRLGVYLEIADKEGVTLCHENESRIYGQKPAEVRDLFASLPGLRGVFDAANYVREGCDPLEGIDATIANLEYVHVKDAYAGGERAIVPAGMGDGQYEEVLRRVDASTDRTVFLTVEPHLHVFQAYQRIDSHKLKTGIEFDNSDDAFDCAVTYLKNLLKKLGYHEEENKIWKK